ncbi:MAG: hypothetical protein J6X82_01115 [Bacteroidales bacterium]|nr:hypothetical protein [Bacteroidales bacterium]
MSRRIYIAALLALSLALSCTKDIDPLTSWSVSAVEGESLELPWRASYESLALSLTGPAEGTRIIVTSSEDWLNLREDILPSDNIVAFSTKTNGSDSRRQATLRFTDADNPSASASITVTQLSRSEQDSNAGDPSDVLYIGYGYDVYKALDNPMAVRCIAPILDYIELEKLNSGSIYNIVTDSHLSRFEMKYVATNSIHAYGENLTRQQTSDNEHPIQGCKEDCINAADNIDPAAGNLEQQNFGHGSLEKAVAARVADKGALLDLKRRGILPFTESYNDRIREIRRNSGAKRLSLVTQALIDYGTHVIIQSDLGGRIDYSFTMSKEVGFNSYAEMQQEIEYTLGRISDSERSGNKRTSSSKQASGAIAVKGGSEAARSTLENDIRGLSPSGQIPPGHLTDWLASINYSDAPERDPNLEVIHFELMPVWDLVPPDLRQDYLDATLTLIDRSDYQLPASFLGTDIYEMSTTDKKLFDFSDAGENNSLCRILYYEGEPVLEVCSEYVPKIRTDERVMVAYPIYKQRIRMNQGLFIGDGVHQPAYVGFSGADCYVQPFEDMAPGSKIDKFWYVNGNLLLQNPSNATLSGKDPRIEEDKFYFVYGSTYSTPVVKIGSRFWTRKDISHHMGFSYDPDDRAADPDEVIENNVLYAPYYYGEVSYFPKRNNKWIYGYTPNTSFDGNPNMRWYLPAPEEVEDLHSFLGFNPKALFKGEASGFDAGFNGYYGYYDVVKQKHFSDIRNRVRYKGQLNVFTARPQTGIELDLIAVLDPNYRFTYYPAEGEFYDEYYPVRVTRGYMFEYPTIKTIENNQFSY